MNENGTNQPAEKRKPGGQPGNHNALRHGLYSKLLLPDEKESLETDSLGRLEDEITMLRALLFRTLKSFNENPPTTFIDRVHAIRAISSTVASLQGVYRTRRYLKNGMSYSERISENRLRMLKGLLPDEE